MQGHGEQRIGVAEQFADLDLTYAGVLQCIAFLRLHGSLAPVMTRTILLQRSYLLTFSKQYRQLRKTLTDVSLSIDCARVSGSIAGRGGMAERLNAPVLKTGEGESLPRVRIPVPPPLHVLKAPHSGALLCSGCSRCHSAPSFSLHRRKTNLHFPARIRSYPRQHFNH